jgi:GT2 family glycosyltransferase
VVVATRDRAARLRVLLESLAAQTFDDFELVVVDDGSSDATPRVLAAEEARGRFRLQAIRRAAGGGPSAARNDGWRAGSGALVAFVDDDCRVTRGWLARLVAEAERAGDAAEAESVVVQGRTLPDPAEARALGPFSRSLWVESPGPYYQACNIAYPRALLERLGGFDAEAFPMVGEDTDLAWRALAAGAAIRWAPDALVHHAVARLGPVGKLRSAARWTPSIRLFARHRALRDVHLTHGVFWKGTHYLLVRALAAAALRRRAPLVAAWLAAPYVRNLLERGRVEGGGPAAAPVYAAHDAVELAAVARGALRYRTPVL